MEEPSVGVALPKVFEFSPLLPVCSTLVDEQTEALLTQEAQTALTS